MERGRGENERGSEVAGRDNGVEWDLLALFCSRVSIIGGRAQCGGVSGVPVDLGDGIS
jgi:hypothetical protein